MDGLYNYKVQEPIFREYLQELDEEQLSRGGTRFFDVAEALTALKR